MNRFVLIMLWCSCLGGSACGSVDNDSADASGGDAMHDTLLMDGLADSLSDSKVLGAQADSSSTHDVNSTDWQIRKPVKVTVHCPKKGPYQAQDRQWLPVDYVCTYSYNGKSGLVYVQSTPTQCEMALVPLPKFSIDKALIKIGESVDKLNNPNYDTGGTHANNELTFEYNGVRFRYYHSSFGMGWRSCHDMDCAIVRNLADNVTEDGCTPDRTRPIVCNRVDENGQYDETMTDTFKKCEGDK